MRDESIKPHLVMRTTEKDELHPHVGRVADELPNDSFGVVWATGDYSIEDACDIRTYHY